MATPEKLRVKTDSGLSGETGQFEKVHQKSKSDQLEKWPFIYHHTSPPPAPPHPQSPANAAPNTALAWELKF